MNRPAIDFTSPTRFAQMRAIAETHPEHLEPLSWRERCLEGVTFLGMVAAAVVGGLLLMGAR